MHLLEQFVSRQITKVDARVIAYALNNYATLVAKLGNIKEAIGYDFTIVETYVENVGLSKAVSSLDSMSQLVMKAQARPKRKGDKSKRKHKNTQPLLSDTDIVTGDD